MNQNESTVRFFDLQGSLRAVEVRRPSTRPMVAAAHAALIALGIVVTSYRANSTPDGIRERFELSQEDGGDLDEQRSLRARSVLLPLAFEESERVEFGEQVSHS